MGGKGDKYETVTNRIGQQDPGKLVRSTEIKPDPFPPRPKDPNSTRLARRPKKRRRTHRDRWEGWRGEGEEGGGELAGSTSERRYGRLINRP